MNRICMQHFTIFITFQQFFHVNFLALIVRSLNASPEGVKYRATVNLNAEPSLNPYCSCTRPFPNVRRPTIVARSQSCKAPAKISLALADSSSTNTTNFPVSKTPSLAARYSRLAVLVPCV